MVKLEVKGDDMTNPSLKEPVVFRNWAMIWVGVTVYLTNPQVAPATRLVPVPFQ